MIFSMKRATFFLMVFQIVILMVLISIFQRNKEIEYRYELSEIVKSVDSEDAMVPSAENKSVLFRLKNDICLDSEGVYRQCDDDTYERIVDSDRKEGLTKEGKQNKETEEREVLFRKMTKTKEKGTLEFKPEVSNHERIPVDDDHDGHDEINENQESRRESAAQQSALMGNVQKIISKKVKNADKRFVSDERILFSEVYEQSDSVRDVKLLVIVSSAARQRARRDSIRATWWTQCSQDSTVHCIFFTDDINSPKLKKARRELLLEKKKYGDIIFQPIDIGLKFGYRILYQLQWAAAHYKFEYLLRVDDDALVCLDHLLYDLPSMRKTNLQWGYLHCEVDDIVYIDEGLIMFSYDLVLKYLSQNPYRMRCHVFGDQQIAIWMNDLDLNPAEILTHDDRIHHSPPASNMQQYFYELDDICKKHIILHGVYPTVMESFWELNRKQDYEKYKPVKFEIACDKPPSFHWYALGYKYMHQPKYCINRPTWMILYLQSKDGSFNGREFNPEQN